MSIFWTSGSLNYYMILIYLKYLPGNIFVNSTLSSVADIIGYMSASFIMNKFGVRLSFMLSYSMAAVFGFLMVIFFKSDGLIIAILVLFTKTGISFAFNLSYLGMS